MWGGTARSVDLVTSDSVQVALSPAEQAAVEMKLAYSGPLMAPVSAGAKVGTVRFMLDGTVLAEVPVETAAGVEEDTSMWSRALDSVLIMVFGS